MSHGLTGAAKQLGRQDAVASKEYLGVVDVLDDSTEVVAAGAAPDRARQPCAGSHQSPPESRPVDEASKVAAPGSVCQVGNQGPQTVAQTLTEEEDAERASCVGSSVPHGAVSAPDVVIATSHDVGNKVPQTVAQTLTEEEDAERASCVGSSVPHGAVSAPDVAIETSHDVGNEVPQTVAAASRV
ncbi:hypothetical protein PC119_g23541 [Phytophthora cactorum]|uniref:Uncharacterized protein n=1 Tax=Phytophthora cactorum TaxID=29920 RepID=A0A8T1CYX7_9STRA|nr:hypothetical protein PC114_g9651 [Phytophthora cactorum]KAG2931710.1 hypothetical protein PC117_g13360 [Phytophthora cactorum]KAG2970873.1 hypothetical protein PC119_g23541 [Phytophthora cactorum]KAG2989230.1 hypothetical protein PC120_g23222 [Phytophthora cactorum]KAG3173468.1 hypothetical protein C6341_g10026 [Phytophthora cactorum]